jgi:hypothetical protein
MVELMSHNKTAGIFLCAITVPNLAAPQNTCMSEVVDAGAVPMCGAAGQSR